MPDDHFDSVVAPRNSDRIRITGEAVEFFNASGVVGMTPRQPGVVEIALVSPAPNASLQRAVDESQRELVQNVSKALKSTMRRVGRSFGWHLRMNIAVFVVGIGSFGLAAWKGVQNPDGADAIVAGVFAGLSAVTFLAYFISRPLAAVASAGPEAAWLLGTVNTYWTKLIYLNNPATFVVDIENAQKELEASMKVYLKTIDYQSRTETVDEGKADKKGKRAVKQPAKRSEPAKKTSTAKKGASAKKAAAARQGAPAKKTPTASKRAPAKTATTVKKSTSAKQTIAAAPRTGGVAGLSTWVAPSEAGEADGDGTSTVEEGT